MRRAAHVAFGVVAALAFLGVFVFAYAGALRLGDGDQMTSLAFITVFLCMFSGLGCFVTSEELP